MAVNKGYLITIEGHDGCGKSTQAKLLAKYLKSKGFKVLLTKEPTDGEIGKLLKEYLSFNFPMIDALLFCADREEHLKKVIEPAIKKGEIVISDRYYYSTLAYQHTQGLDLKWLLELNKFFLKPNLAIFIDVESEACIKRIKSDIKHIGVEKFEQLKFLEKVRKNFLKLARILKNENIVIVNGNRNIQEVHKDIIKCIEKNVEPRL